MSRHEHFEELCALAATAQLSLEDERLLSDHLKDCGECREVSQEFSLILHTLPAPDDASEDHAVLQYAEDAGFRQRFLNRARAEGRRFSQQALEGPSTTRRWIPKLVPVLQFATAGIAIAIVVSALAYRTFRVASRESSAAKASSTPAVTIDSRPTLTANDRITPKLTELESLNEQSQQTIKSLKMENVALATRTDALEKQTEAGRAERDELQKVLARANDINSQLTRQLEQNDQTIAQTTAELERTRADRTAVSVELASEKMKVNELSEQARLQTASLDHDKQLLFAGRDITDLMGARNLHIIDVHDADGSGKDRKSFGRVFYTEGKSLIFYAFDLDDKKVVNAKYTFEAWGERLGEATSVKSLGVLYVDDKDQRRWVLKVDDPRQLAEIDSVFVTLEPHDSAGDKPRGRKILYAFLSGQPNHP